MLTVLLSWLYCRRPRHSMLLLHVTAMTFTLVYTEEHLVIDVLLGWSYAAASVGAVTAVQAFLRVHRRVGARVVELSPSPGSRVPACPPEVAPDLGLAVVDWRSWCSCWSLR